MPISDSRAVRVPLVRSCALTAAQSWIFVSLRRLPQAGIWLVLVATSACVQARSDLPAPAESGGLHVTQGLASAPSVSRKSIRIDERFADLRDFLDLSASYQLAADVDLLTEEVFPGQMTLIDAARLSLASGTAVRIAEAQASAQAAVARATRRSLGPQISLAGELSQELENTETTNGPLARTSSFSLEVSRPLINLPRQQEILRQANDAQTAARALDNARSLAILGAINAYLAVLQSQLIIVYAEEYEVRLETLKRVMEERVQAGGSSPAELERVVARIQGIRATISDVRAGLSTGLADLVILTGQRPVEIALPRGVGFPIPARSADAFEVALVQNWDVKTSTGQLRTNEIRLREVALRDRPTVDATLSQDLGTDWSNGSTQSRDTTLGVSFNWTLYRSGMLREELASANAGVAEAEARLDEATDGLRRNLRESYIVLAAIQEQMDAYKQQVTANQAVVEAFTEQVTATNRPVLDVLEAYQTLFQSKIDLTNLFVTEAQLNLQILHLLGELSLERLSGKG